MKWWYWLLLSLGSVMIIGGILSIIQPWVDKPEFTSDEVIAIVKFHLTENNLLRATESADFMALYGGNGKWGGYCQTQVTKNGQPKWTNQYGQVVYTDNIANWGRISGGVWWPVMNRIIWNFYEKSKTTEIVTAKEFTLR